MLQLRREAAKLWPSVWRFLAIMNRLLGPAADRSATARALDPPLRDSGGLSALLEGMEQRRTQAEFARYERHQGVFTPVQWQVVVAHYQQGMSQGEIARALRKTPSAVSECLKRAHQTLIRAELALRAAARKHLERPEEAR